MTHLPTTRLTAALLFIAAAVLPCAAVAGAPLAECQPKFLGSAFSDSQSENFLAYWNKVTPENAGKWGRAEPERDAMQWEALDAAYAMAKENGLPYHHHVLIWGNQQPAWIETLPAAEQRDEIEEWFAAVAERYPGIDIVEVVNEPLHDPPDRPGKGGGNYVDALGGSGATGWDWVIEAFRLARTHFPDAELMLNEYSVTNNRERTREYLEIIALLQEEDLIDVIGVQGHAFSTRANVPMDVHERNLDALAATGLPIHVTELDVDGPSDEIQRADYERIFPVFWEHPGVEGITLWGYRAGLWRSEDRAELVDEDGTERPALAWLRDYVKGSLLPAGE